MSSLSFLRPDANRESEEIIQNMCAPWPPISRTSSKHTSKSSWKNVLNLNSRKNYNPKDEPDFVPFEDSDRATGANNSTDDVCVGGVAVGADAESAVNRLAYPYFQYYCSINSLLTQY